MVTHAQARPFTAAPAAPSSPAWFRRFGRAAWIALQAVGARRARRELTHLAASCELTNPALAAQLRRVVREDWLSRG